MAGQTGGGLLPHDHSGKGDGGESLSPGEINGIQYLDNNDPDRPDVDEYINNNLSSGEIVYIESGTHVCSELTPGFNSFAIIWEGTVQPDGDHPVFTSGNGAIRHYIYPVGSGVKIDTTNQGTYTSDAVNQHCKILMDMPLKVSATGRRVSSSSSS